MAGHFWDTSALVKHYHPEIGTAKVDALLQVTEVQQVLSRLGVTESFSVFAGKVRVGLVTHAEFDKLCRRFLADTRGKLFSVARLLVAHFKVAEKLLRGYGTKPGQGIRTLDALHSPWQSICGTRASSTRSSLPTLACLPLHALKASQ